MEHGCGPVCFSALGSLRPLSCDDVESVSAVDGQGRALILHSDGEEERGGIGMDRDEIDAADVHFAAWVPPELMKQLDGNADGIGSGPTGAKAPAGLLGARVAEPIPDIIAVMDGDQAVMTILVSDDEAGHVAAERSGAAGAVEKMEATGTLLDGDAGELSWKSIGPQRVAGSGELQDAADIEIRAIDTVGSGAEGNEVQFPGGIEPGIREGRVVILGDIDEGAFRPG